MREESRDCRLTGTTGQMEEEERAAAPLLRAAQPNDFGPDDSTYISAFVISRNGNPALSQERGLHGLLFRRHPPHTSANTLPSL